MTPTLRNPMLTIVTAGVAFAVAIVVLMLVNRSATPATGSGAGEDVSSAIATGSAQVSDLQDVVESGEAGPAVYAALGNAQLDQLRDTGDTTLIADVETAFTAALDRDPENLAATVGLGELALSRHDFRSALTHGNAAQRISPRSVAPFAVLVDAKVELGRYGAAERTLQRMIDYKPSLASYARVSYFRELHGDVAGAVEAMRLAAAATPVPGQDRSYVQSLLGDLEFQRGRLGAAAAQYQAALAGVPGYEPADAGLAAVEAARGEETAAIDRLEAVLSRRPGSPEYLIPLAELELATGREEAAAGHLEQAHAEERKHIASGETPDAEGALFEADHGNPGFAVKKAEEAYAFAPSVRAADALGWALTRDGKPERGLAFAEEALRLGSRAPLFLYHAGIAAKRAGEDGAARVYLSRALAGNPSFSPLYAPRARAALRGLG